MRAKAHDLFRDDSCSTVRHPEYRDHAGWSDERIVQDPPLEPTATETTGRGRVQKRFTTTLYRLLEDVDGTPNAKAIHWLPHGRAFVVKDPIRFANEVLPLYFPKQSEYRSFQRQLNLYGFLRLVRQGNGYYHERFLRCRFALSKSVPRVMRGRRSTRHALDSSSEPNFNTLPWLPDFVPPQDRFVVPSIDKACDSPTILPLHRVSPISLLLSSSEEGNTVQLQTLPGTVTCGELAIAHVSASHFLPREVMNSKAKFGTACHIPPRVVFDSVDPTPNRAPSVVAKDALTHLPRRHATQDPVSPIGGCSSWIETGNESSDRDLWEDDPSLGCLMSDIEIGVWAEIGMDTTYPEHPSEEWHGNIRDFGNVRVDEDLKAAAWNVRDGY